MAITVAEGVAAIVQDYPELTTEVTLTLTLDGSATTLTNAGTAHGGLSGVEPDEVYFQRWGGDSTDSVVAQFNINNIDTTNDEVDWKVYLSGAGTNTKTLVYKMLCKWYKQATGGIS